ncbi:MAG TPA: carboxymuconolactone decarboxylase family protein [Longimicrobiaceae bacterium]|nr:carboxymuconolactone decarboxylase family protein [Longimicrobiaceae bacterium]
MVAREIEPEVRSLVQAYVAFLSGCDECTLASLRAAREMDRDPERLTLLATWKRAPLERYSDRERAALVWAEVVAVSGEEGVGEALRDRAEQKFSAAELASLTEIVRTARGWKRIEREVHAVGEAAGPHRRFSTARCEHRTVCRICAEP